MKTDGLSQKLYRFFFGEDQSSSTNMVFSMVGEAIVVSDIEPNKEGRVKFQGTEWFGRCADNCILKAGEVVQVLDREANTLIVQSKYAKPFARVPKTPSLLPPVEVSHQEVKSPTRNPIAQPAHPTLKDPATLLKRSLSVPSTQEDAKSREREIRRMQKVN
jgi:hypothetical protein